MLGLHDSLLQHWHEPGRAAHVTSKCSSSGGGGSGGMRARSKTALKVNPFLCRSEPGSGGAAVDGRLQTGRSWSTVSPVDERIHDGVLLGGHWAVGINACDIWCVSIKSVLTCNPLVAKRFWRKIYRIKLPILHLLI